jgi:hypothetical protein
VGELGDPHAPIMLTSAKRATVPLRGRAASQSQRQVSRPIPVPLRLSAGPRGDQPVTSARIAASRSRLYTQLLGVGTAAEDQACRG